MKKVLLILLLVASFSLTSCTSDDDNSGGNDYPQTLNIKFDITTTRNSDAIINRTLDNETETDQITSLPYSFTYVQQEVNQETYLKLTFQDNGVYLDTLQGSSWTDYDAELKIIVDNNVVKTETFEITEGIGIVHIDYTFE